MGKIEHKHRRLRILGLMVLLYASLPVFILSTNPDRLPLPLLLVPFVLFFVSIFMTLLLAGRRTRLLRGFGRRKQLTVCALLTLIPVLLAVFQSLHQLTVRDLLIAAGLVAAASFYISRAEFLR